MKEGIKSVTLVQSKSSRLFSKGVETASNCADEMQPKLC